jgi:hypothetical protein
MDLQLLCNPHAAGQYACAAYVSKVDVPDQHNLSKRVLKIMYDDSVFCTDAVSRKVLYKCAMATVNATQTSAQECAWFLLGYKLVYCSNRVVTVNVKPPDLRSQVLQPPAPDGDERGADRPLFKRCTVDKGILDYMNLDISTLGEEGNNFSAFHFLTKYSSSVSKKGTKVSSFISL